MIKSLHIKNFQSHKDSSLVFHPGVNTLIGTSSHGKSAVVRALILGIKNDPTGTEFISDWIVSEKGTASGNTQVVIEVEEGNVTRIKGRENQYLINDEEMKAFRTHVPERVTSFLNINDLNIQEQKDSFFLFNVSSGEVVKQINKFMNLDLIDQTLTAAKSSMLGNKRLSQLSLSSLEETNLKLQEYAIIETLSGLLERAETIQGDINEYTAKSQEINKIVTRYSQVNTMLDTYKELDRVSRRVERAVVLAEEVKETNRTLIKLENLVEAYNQKAKTIPELPDERSLNKAIRIEQELASLITKKRVLDDKLSIYQIGMDSKSNLIIADIDFAFYTTQITSNAEAKRKVGVVLDYIDDYYELLKKKETLELTISKTQEQYTKLMPNVCPLCGNECKEDCK